MAPFRIRIMEAEHEAQLIHIDAVLKSEQAKNEKLKAQISELEAKLEDIADAQIHVSPTCPAKSRQKGVNSSSSVSSSTSAIETTIQQAQSRPEAAERREGSNGGQDRRADHFGQAERITGIRRRLAHAQLRKRILGHVHDDRTVIHATIHHLFVLCFLFLSLPKFNLKLDLMVNM